MSPEQQLLENAAPEQPSTYSRLKNWWRVGSNRWLRFRGGFQRRVAELNLSQWMYLIAFVVFIGVHEDGDWQSQSLLWTGLIAGIGLTREMWRLFNRIWSTILGKGIFLILYASTANFAIALAALKVNAIAGIEPEPLRFTLGFTTLLMLPFFAFVASLVLAIIVLMLGNLWLLFALLMRLVRVRLPVHWEDKSFATVTMVLRLILLPTVIVSMFLVIKPYIEQVIVFDRALQIIDGELNKENRAAPIEGETEIHEQMVEEFKAADVSITEPLEKTKDTQEKGPGPIDKLIASFIYQFETYPSSSCIIQKGERVLTIDDVSMLVVNVADNDLGFAFSVRDCIRKNVKLADSVSQQRVDESVEPSSQ